MYHWRCCQMPILMFNLPNNFSTQWKEKRNFELKNRIFYVFIHFTKTKSHEETLQINFYHQKVTVENKYYLNYS